MSQGDAEVVVVTGAGGMGEAIVRRLGPGKRVVLADRDPGQLAVVGDRLRASGLDVVGVVTDISSRVDVAALADVAASYGRVTSVVHTAGVSPVQATSEQIVAVDIVGTALVLDIFEAQVQPGTVAVCIASMAGHMMPIDDETRGRFANTPTDTLSSLPEFDTTNLDPGTAYSIAKRANLARVEAASIPWGARGGRVVSISPGVIATPMGQAELESPHGGFMRMMVDNSGTGRLGSAEDIASVVQFLVSSGASFITGTDILVDGGVMAALHNPKAS